jgi:hypothetical protein
MTTVGSTFSPRITLTDTTASVWWEVNGQTVATGTAPDINFGTATTRTVKMGVSKNGGDRLDLVQVINLGFDTGSDAGWYTVPSSHNHPSQQVTGISGVNKCSNLKYFLAAHLVEYDNSSNGKVLAGNLDLSGLSKLEHVECYFAQLSSIDVTGCTSLIRLCLEHNALTSVDLNPVAPNLKDFRCAIQRGGSLTLVPLTQPLANLYHFCVRDQPVTNFPAASKLPKVSEMFVWNTGQTSISASSNSLTKMLVYLTPTLTTINLANQFSGAGVLQAFGCNLTTVDITNCLGLGTIDLTNSHMSATLVDSVLNQANAWNTSGAGGAKIDLSGATNAAPTSASSAARTALTARGWNIITN